MLQKSSTFCPMDRHTYRLIGKVTDVPNWEGRRWCLNSMEVSWIINFYVDINEYSGPEQVCGVSYCWERQDCTIVNMPKSCQCGCWQQQTLWLPSSKISTQSVTHPTTRQGDGDSLRVLSLMLQRGGVHRCGSWVFLLPENGLLLLNSLLRTRDMNCCVQYTHK